MINVVEMLYKIKVEKRLLVFIRELLVILLRVKMESFLENL